MESDLAAEHLQTIRTLMERSALYRRALAPIMICNGALGVVAASFGWLFRIDSPRGFVWFWASIAVVGLGGSFLLVRRQALKDAEPFWSPPTRRVVQAILPPLVAGLLLGVLVIFASGPTTAGVSIVSFRLEVTTSETGDFRWVPLAWAVLYGCALHAAGFFTSRGLRLFGWVFVIAGSATLIWLASNGAHATRPQQSAHLFMGILFGALHLAYGAYLYSTGEGKNAA